MTTVEKMTKKETYEMIMNLIHDAYEAGDEKADYAVEFCEKEIVSLEKKAEKARETAAKKKAEGDELLEIVYAALSEEDFETIADITAKVVEVEPEATVGKVQYRLNALFKADRAEKSQIVIPATEDTKMRKVTGYRKIAG